MISLRTPKWLTLSALVLSALLLVIAMPAPASGRSVQPAVVEGAGVLQADGILGASGLQASAVLRPGMRGPQVRALQQRLVDLKYWLGSLDGIYGYLTTQAIMAFQKVNGLARDGIAGPQTLAALRHPVRPRPRSSAARVVEVVKAKQVVLLVRYGKVSKIFNAATGTARTPTPSGSYRVYRQINGWRRSPLGLLYRPKYFVGGYALHGSTSVPAYRASHGCVRVNLKAMDYLWSRVPLGTRVRIY